MANETFGAGKPEIGPLYVKMTTPRTDGAVELPGALDIFGKLSISSQFKVALHLTPGGDPLMTYLNGLRLTNDATKNELYNFYCAEASLPGATFESATEIGSRQGIVETFPTRRVYPEFTMTFYVDNDYRLIRLFEEWMNYINPLYTSGGILPGSEIGQGQGKDKVNFFRFKYPDTYRRIISIVKFERNFLKDPQFSNRGPVGDVPTLTYRMIEAYPTNITAIPLSYEGSTITKTTVSFAYTRYVLERNRGTGDLN